MGEVAERWLELGEAEKAKALFAEGLTLARQITSKGDLRRGRFASRLARVNLAAALELLQELRTGGEAPRVLEGLAFRLTEKNPAEAERVWKSTWPDSRVLLVWTGPAFYWKMATVDPARSLRGVEKDPVAVSNPEWYFFVALGAKSRDESVSTQAFQAGLHGLDRLGEREPASRLFSAGDSLPVVERIDPALVPEVFWREVASRGPIGNPRNVFPENSTSHLISRAALYNREVAAALFEPVRAVITQTPRDDPGASRPAIEAWSFFDPRAAAAWLEALPMPADPTAYGRYVRLSVAQSLALPHEARWRTLYEDCDIVFGGPRREF
jgi:hypothetical protein